MRLLQRKDDGEFSLVEYVGNNIPRYAILSHTWGAANKEVTFKDLTEGAGKDKPGYRKIHFCAQQAITDNLHYSWVDTCCIDKSSSAELSEAINSMYQWYRDANTCYVYLEDVSASDQPHPKYNVVSSFEKSKWFSRGWTLQELIAPLEVVFYSKEWEIIGTKSDLIEHLADITKIDVRVLEGVDPKICSIASRMSWASNRETTRVEDIAYSLLGIFNINMPLLYGEGERSFLRLQEEIMKISDDQSLFAWRSKDSNCQPYSGLLARRPAYFKDSGSLCSPQLGNNSEPSSLTSKGLCANFDLRQCLSDKGIYHALLDCEVHIPPNLQKRENRLRRFRQATSLTAIWRPAITLQLLSVLRHGKQFVRIHTGTLHTFKEYLWFIHTSEKVYVRQDLFPLLPPSRFLTSIQEPGRNNLFLIRGTADFRFTNPVPHDNWHYQTGLFSLPPLQIGRVLVTHCGRVNRKMSLLFRNSEDRSVCRLDDPTAVPSRLDVEDISSFDTVSEYRLWKGFRGLSSMFATARISQTKDYSHPVTVVTVCLKSVRFSGLNGTDSLNIQGRLV